MPGNVSAMDGNGGKGYPDDVAGPDETLTGDGVRVGESVGVAISLFSKFEMSSTAGRGRRDDRSCCCCCCCCSLSKLDTEKAEAIAVRGVVDSDMKRKRGKKEEREKRRESGREDD